MGSSSSLSESSSRSQGQQQQPRIPNPKDRQPSYFASPALDQAFSGIAAGTIATLCMHPLDLLKVQFQVSTTSAPHGSKDQRSWLPPQDPKPQLSSAIKVAGATNPAAVDRSPGGIINGGPGVEKVKARTAIPTTTLASTTTKLPYRQQLWGHRPAPYGLGWGQEIYHALKGVVKKDGITGLYRGISANVLGNASGWGLYFMWYSQLKYMVQTRTAASSTTSTTPISEIKLSASQHWLCATTAGISSSVVTNPIWVVKTRMFTSSRPRKTTTASTTTKEGHGPLARSVRGETIGKEGYRNVLDGLIQIARTEGLQGLYRGALLSWVATLSSAIQFTIYEEMKKWRKEKLKMRGTGTKDLSNSEYLFFSGASKLISLTLTYPYQVLRSRIQFLPSLYPNVKTTVLKTFTQEGLPGFYKGLALNSLRVLPNTCVTFVVYENCSRILRERGVIRLD